MGNSLSAVLVLLAIAVDDASPQLSASTTKAWTDAGAELIDGLMTSRFGPGFNSARGPRGDFRYFDARRVDKLEGLPEPEIEFGLQLAPRKLPAWVPVLAKFRRLTHLYVHDPVWSKDDLEVINKLSQTVHIEAIYTRVSDRAKFQNETKPAIRALAGLEVPLALNLRQIEIGDDSLQSLAPLPTLRALYLSDLHGKGLALKAFPAMTVLSIHNGIISPEAVSTFAELKQLTHLDVSYTKVGDPLADAIKDLPKLSHLNLQEARLSDVGFKKLKALELVWLDTGSSPELQPETLLAFAMLERLDASRASFAPTAWAKLGALKRLKRLVVGDNAAPEAIAALKAALPQCQIEKE